LDHSVIVYNYLADNGVFKSKALFKRTRNTLKLLQVIWQLMYSNGSKHFHMIHHHGYNQPVSDAPRDKPITSEVLWTIRCYSTGVWSIWPTYRSDI